MPDLLTTPERGNFFVRMHPFQRLLISAVCALVVFLLVRKDLSKLVLVMLLWDVFAIAFLVMAWIVICTRSVPQMKIFARKEDNSKIVISILVIGASFASMFMVLLLILSKDTSTARAFSLPVAIVGVLLSWILVHTIFTFHYANMYYDDDNEDPNHNAYGLDFPGGAKDPDYLDFAYFAFVIGMTFQVSDVQINCRTIRRQALVHGLLSFALNTFVVALTINVIAGLKG